MTAEPRLVVEELAIGHSGHAIAAGIDFRCHAGAITCLLGPNGVGKTTLYRTLLGLIRPLAGRVLLGGDDIAGLGRTAVARRAAYVPQSQGIGFPYCAHDIVLMGRTARIGGFAAPAQADRAAADEALARLGIARLAGRVFDRLSGGERQLVLVARAVAQGSGLVVMDEPTASLDLANAAHVLGVLRSLAAGGTAVVFSTHDPNHAFAVADRVVTMAPGGRTQAGRPDAVLDAASIAALYGVEVALRHGPPGAPPVVVPVIPTSATGTRAPVPPL